MVEHLTPKPVFLILISTHCPHQWFLGVRYQVVSPVDKLLSEFCCLGLLYLQRCTRAPHPASEAHCHLRQNGTFVPTRRSQVQKNCTGVQIRPLSPNPVSLSYTQQQSMPIPHRASSETAPSLPEVPLHLHWSRGPRLKHSASYSPGAQVFNLLLPKSLSSLTAAH